MRTPAKCPGDLGKLVVAALCLAFLAIALHERAERRCSANPIPQDVSLSLSFWIGMQLSRSGAGNRKAIHKGNARRKIKFFHRKFRFSCREVRTPAKYVGDLGKLVVAALCLVFLALLALHERGWTALQQILPRRRLLPDESGPRLRGGGVRWDRTPASLLAGAGCSLLMGVSCTSGEPSLP